MQENAKKIQAELIMRQREVEARNAGNMVAMQQAAQSYEVEMAKLAQASELTLAELQNRLQVEIQKRETAREKIMSDLEQQNKEIAVKYEFGEGL